MESSPEGVAAKLDESSGCFQRTKNMIIPDSPRFVVFLIPGYGVPAKHFAKKKLGYGSPTKKKRGDGSGPFVSSGLSLVAYTRIQPPEKELIWYVFSLPYSNQFLNSCKGCW